MSKYIKLTQGKVAIVDDEDFELISQYKWYPMDHHNNFYARANVYKNKKRTQIKMHRLIMNVINPKVQIDHIDRDGLNNQKSNLRICTNSQNHMNEKKRKNCSSRFKGVSWHKRCKKWMAKIKTEDKQKHLGYFNNEKDAAKAYDAAAKKYFGKFARLNVNGQ